MRTNISSATYHAWKKKFGGMEVSEAKRLRALEDENSRLKRLVADQAVQIHILKEVNAKKAVSPSARRRAVKMSVQEGIGKVAATCRALGLSRSSYYRSGRSSLESRRIRKEVLELSAKLEKANQPPESGRKNSVIWIVQLALRRPYTFAKAGRGGRGVPEDYTEARAVAVTRI
jgi:hypothetical protein